MSTQLHRLLCRLGLHDWEQVTAWEPDKWDDPDYERKPHGRFCGVCHKSVYWSDPFFDGKLLGEHDG